MSANLDTVHRYSTGSVVPTRSYVVELTENDWR
jgi:hypothetical protein